MADLIVNPATVSLVNGDIERAFAGESISAGQVIGVHRITSQCELASALVDGLPPRGIALNSAFAGQPITYALPESILELGIPLAAGAIFVLSRTPGNISPLADQGQGDRVILVGWGNAQGKFVFRLRDTHELAAAGDVPMLGEDGQPLYWENGEPMFFE